MRKPTFSPRRHGEHEETRRKAKENEERWHCSANDPSHALLEHGNIKIDEQA
jgi:hypothetical protein